MIHAGQKDDLRQRLASNGAEVGREVLRLLHAIDFVAGCASQFDDKFSPVSNLLRVCCVKMNAGAVVGIRFGLQKRSQDRDLLRRETIMRHGRRGIVDAGICEPCIQPVGLCLVADAREFGTDVAADEVTRRILDGVAGGAERFAIQAWSRRLDRPLPPVEPQRPPYRLPALCCYSRGMPRCRSHPRR